MPASGEHHHVAPVHPEYAKLPDAKRDLTQAKKLLAEAGYASGLEVEVACKNHPAWEQAAVTVMAEMWKEAGINAKINVMPAASAAVTTDLVCSRFSRHPKLLQPRPTRETSRSLSPKR